MNNTCNIISEYVYNKSELDKTRKSVEDALDEYERRYGYHRIRIVNVLCLAKFLDKVEKGTKVVHIKIFNIIGELNKIMQSSQG